MVLASLACLRDTMGAQWVEFIPSVKPQNSYVSGKWVNVHFLVVYPFNKLYLLYIRSFFKMLKFICIFTLHPLE